MASVVDILADIIESIKKLFGLTTPENDKRRAAIKEWKDKRRILEAQVDSLKADIREAQDRVRAKEVERKAAVSDPETLPIIEEEIKSLFQQLDLKTQKRDIIFGGIDRLTKLIEQAENVILGSATSTVAPETFMEMQLQVSDVLGQLREADREAARLGSMQYHRPTTEVANLEQRKAAVTETNEQSNTAAAPQAVAKPATSLSEAQLERLARMRQTDTN